MLSRFICPVARFGELDAFTELFAKSPPFRFSALGRGGDGLAAFTAGFVADLHDIRAFRRRHPGRVEVDAFEVALSPDVAAEPGERFAEVAAAMATAFEEMGPFRLKIALEVGVSPETLGPVLDAVRAANDRLGNPATDDAQGFGPFLVKLRLGGVTAGMFPSVDDVAAAIVAARDREVPLKLTAGLHHPLRRLDPDTGAMMHGFLNVYAAAVLAAVHALGVDEVRKILADEEASHFGIEPETLAWGGHVADFAEVARVRRAGVTSYGSCSFDEPREDLARLGLLPEYPKPS